VIFAYADAADAALKRGVYIEKIIDTPLRADVMAMQDIPSAGFAQKAEALIESIEREFATAE